MNQPSPIFLIIVCSLISCGKGSFTPLDEKFVDNYRSLAIDVNLDFQFDLFKEVVHRSEKGSNQILSPLSISMALGMLYHGALGNTREEIHTLLGYGDMLKTEVLNYQRSQIKYLEGLDSEATFLVSNAIFYDPSRVITRAGFLDKNAENNRAFTQSLDFDHPSSVDKINTWVFEATHRKIDHLIDHISERDVMVILNALYFEGGWHRPFDPKKTRKTSFHINDNEVIDVDMMSTEDVLAGHSGDNLKAFELALGQEQQFSMVFILPEGELDAWINQAVPNGISGILDQLVMRNFVVGLPKFEISSNNSLKEVLQTLGMNTAFGSQAQFSDLGAGPQGQHVELSRVDHTAYFKVDERGVEAATSTDLVPIVVSTAYPLFLIVRLYSFYGTDPPITCYLLVKLKTHTC